MKTLVGSILAAGMCVFVLPMVFSQTETLDPTILSPDIYATRLENDAVRVIQVNATDGMHPAIHSHPDRVVIYVTDCTWIETTEDGRTVEESYKAGDVVWETATTHGGNVNHVRESCTLLEVELK